VSIALHLRSIVARPRLPSSKWVNGGFAIIYIYANCVYLLFILSCILSATAYIFAVDRSYVFDVVFITIVL
jgi:hypothetical protein